MSKGKAIVRAGATRARKFMGLSVPVAEVGLATAAGMFGVNYLAGVVHKFAVEKAIKDGDEVGKTFLTSWFLRVMLKVTAGVFLGWLVRKVPRVGQRWGSGILGGALAGAALTVAKQFLPKNYDTHWGLAGDAADDPSMGYDPMSMMGGGDEIDAIANRLGEESELNPAGMYT